MSICLPFSAATDVAIGFGDPLKEIVDINFQAGPDSQLPDRGLLYSAALQFRYRVPVRTIFILLHPKANLANLSGSLTYTCGASGVEFRYEVVRLWEQPAEYYLNAGLGVVPLAVLGALPTDQPEADGLRMIAERIEKRLRSEALPEIAARLMSAACNLTRLRIQRSELIAIFGGTGFMKTAYDEMVEDYVRQTQKILLQQGSDRFGPPEAETEKALRAIDDLDRLERMTRAVLKTRDWHELLSTW
jgi:hypothetical protein